MALDLVEYSDEIKLNAVEFYALTGDIRQTAAAVSVPPGTIRAWKRRDWWIDKLREIKAEQNREISAKYDILTRKAQEIVADRLENGEVVVTNKGTLVTKPISARDAVTILGIVADKKNQMDANALAEGGEATIQQQLATIAEEFIRFAKAKDVTPKKRKSTNAQQPELQEGLQTGSPDGGSGEEGPADQTDPSSPRND